MSLGCYLPRPEFLPGAPVHWRDVGGIVTSSIHSFGRTRLLVSFPAYDPAMAGEEGPAYRAQVIQILADDPELEHLHEVTVGRENPPGWDRDSSSWFLGLLEHSDIAPCGHHVGSRTASTNRCFSADGCTP